MKMDRLIGILSLLLQRDSVREGELAERFEVSVRTIRRDVDELCRAGIPIATRPGRGGGISVMEGYRVDRTLLTRSELRDILAGLRSLNSVDASGHFERLMEKLSAGASDFMTGGQSVLIDLSSWYGDTLAPKIALLRSAIDGAHPVRFRYFAPGGESVRRVEPCYLVFRWSSWYLWGWCRAREDFRLFKLNRMEELEMEGETFARRSAPLPELRSERIFPGRIHARARFAPECRWRLVEEFGASCFEEQADGRLLFRADYSSVEELLRWMLTFGDRAELLEPEPLRAELREMIGRMAEVYKEK